MPRWMIRSVTPTNEESYPGANAEGLTSDSSTYVVFCDDDEEIISVEGERTYMDSNGDTRTTIRVWLRKPCRLSDNDDAKI